MLADVVHEARDAGLPLGVRRHRPDEAEAAQGVGGRANSFGSGSATEAGTDCLLQLVTPVPGRNASTPAVEGMTCNDRTLRWPSPVDLAGRVGP